MRDLAPELGFLPDEPDGPRMRRAVEFTEQRQDLAPRRDPIVEERS